jgi:hypothetical protein
MRIGRLEFGISIDFSNWGLYESLCYCKMLDLGWFYVTWLSYECMAGLYRDKGRRYRIKKYLKSRATRPSNPQRSSSLRVVRHDE